MPVGLVSVGETVFRGSALPIELWRALERSCSVVSGLEECRGFLRYGGTAVLRSERARAVE